MTRQAAVTRILTMYLVLIALGGLGAREVQAPAVPAPIPTPAPGPAQVQLSPMAVPVVPVPVGPSSATIAIIAVSQILLLAIVQGAITYFTKAKEASQAITAAAAAAKLRSEEKAEDWRRQDDVAARVAAAAKASSDEIAMRADLLLKAQQDTILRTDEVARIAAENDQKMNGKLDSIHTLVNSDMTAARTAERDSMKLLVLALKRIGTKSPEEQDEIVRVEKRIEELNQILADRLAAQAKVDADKADKAARGEVE